jgi:pterin-4a-carbinolamine dehydratase
VAATDVDLLRALRGLAGWHRHGNTISKTFRFDDFATATRFVDRVALDAAAAGRRPAIDVRGDRVTVAFAPRDGHTLTLDDLAAARRIQRLVGDHRPPSRPGRPLEPPTGDRPLEPPDGWPAPARSRGRPGRRRTQPQAA